MKNMKKESGVSAISIVFYVVAVIFLGIAVYGIYQGYLTVENYKLQYTMTLLDIMGIYFTACAQYFAYAFILYGIGTVLTRVSVLSNVLGGCLEVEKEEVASNEEHADTASDSIEATEA